MLLTLSAACCTWGCAGVGGDQKLPGGRPAIDAFQNALAADGRPAAGKRRCLSVVQLSKLLRHPSTGLIAQFAEIWISDLFADQYFDLYAAFGANTFAGFALAESLVPGLMVAMGSMQAEVMDAAVKVCTRQPKTASSGQPSHMLLTMGDILPPTREQRKRKVTVDSQRRPSFRPQTGRFASAPVVLMRVPHVCALHMSGSLKGDMPGRRASFLQLIKGRRPFIPAR